MPPPQFSECSICQRLYSQHSLVIHQKTCGKKKKRSKSSKRKNEPLPERPRTRSLSRSSIDVGQLRVCYVCGGQFETDEMGQHVKLCLQDWSDLSAKLSKKFQITPPKTLNIPSIDGTINIFYENQKSLQSSRSCQIVRCRKCMARIGIHLADQHQCTHYEPTIEFYF